MTLVMPKDPKPWLVQRARDLAVGINPLFHGTRYPDEILASGSIKAGSIGDSAVCFSRSPEEAAFWATLPRDDDEGRGAVFVFDRSRLLTRYRLDLVNDGIDRDEHEERVWERDVTLTSGLIGIASQPIPTRSREERWRAYNVLPVTSADLNGDSVMFTRAVLALGPKVQEEILEALSGYDDCGADKNPASEQDFHVVTVGRHKILFEILCLDRDPFLRFAAADRKKPRRLVTVTLADGQLPIPTNTRGRSDASGALAPA